MRLITRRGYRDLEVAHRLMEKVCDRIKAAETCSLDVDLAMMRLDAEDFVSDIDRALDKILQLEESE